MQVRDVTNEIDTQTGAHINRIRMGDSEFDEAVVTRQPNGTVTLEAIESDGYEWQYEFELTERTVKAIEHRHKDRRDFADDLLDALLTADYAILPING